VHGENLPRPAAGKRPGGRSFIRAGGCRPPSPPLKAWSPTA
jgi:hypothetical protein